MDEASSSFSAIFNAKKSIVCIHDVELEITNEKCTIKGHATVLPERCHRSISMNSFLDQ
jgi:hypothetical protein